MNIVAEISMYPLQSNFHGTNVSGERQRPGMVVPWSTSGAGPQAKPKAPAVGHLHGITPTGSWRRSLTEQAAA